MAPVHDIDRDPRSADGSCDPSTEPVEVGLDLGGLLRCKWAALRLRVSPLWRHICRFSKWLENDAFPAARELGHEGLRLEFTGDGEIRLLGIWPDGPIEAPGDCERVGRFLAEIGVRLACLDTRLESNQITNVLTLLYTMRRRLRKVGRRPGRNGFAKQLAGETGVGFACAQTRLHQKILSIKYSYCLTSFSRVVHWFVRRNPRLADHRALFHAAPRWALLLAGITTIPFLIYTFSEVWWLLLAVTAAGAVAVFAVVYVFFMTIGSEEYDSEEKSHRLTAAYDSLQRYTKRVQDDLQRARVVQRRFLPPEPEMPLGDRLTWASRFEPATEVGGDYFDAAAVGPEQAIMLFGDVSGHGMAAAFITAILKCAFLRWVEDGSSLPEFVIRLNRQLCQMTPDDSFAAVFLGAYDGQAGTMQYVNGGHHPEPWRIPADPDEPIRPLRDGRATILGAVDDLQLHVGQAPMAPGDAVVFVTDGIIEAPDLDGALYGHDRLMTLLNAHRAEPIAAVVEAIVDDVNDHARGAEQTDDRTILAFQVNRDGNQRV